MPIEPEHQISEETKKTIKKEVRKISIKKILLGAFGSAILTISLYHLYIHINEKMEFTKFDVILIIVMPLLGAMMIGGMFSSPGTISRFFDSITKLLSASKFGNAKNVADDPKSD